MPELSEYLQHHYYLAAAALAALLVLAWSEFRQATRASASLSPAEVVRLLNGGAVLLDVREQAAFEAGHIGNARNVPGPLIAAGASGLERFKDKVVIAYCDSGLTSGSAARELARQGFTKAYNLAGGIEQWRRDNLPTTKK
jgi:rhodanese-related sulfurtransferase